MTFRSLSLCSSLKWIGTIIHWLSLLLTFFFCEKKIPYIGEREKLFLGPGCFQNWNPMVRYAGQSQNCQPYILYYILYLCYFIQEKKRAKENCMEGVTIENIPRERSGSDSTASNSPKEFHFPRIYFYFYFFLLLLLRIQYILFSLWNMLLGDVTSRWYSSASFSSSKSVSHLSDLI